MAARRRAGSKKKAGARVRAGTVEPRPQGEKKAVGRAPRAKAKPGKSQSARTKPKSAATRASVRKLEAEARERARKREEAAERRVKRERAQRRADRAAERAKENLERLILPRTPAEERRYEEAKANYKDALERAGVSAASINARLGWSTRRRQVRTKSAYAPTVARYENRVLHAEIRGSHESREDFVVRRRVLYQERREALRNILSRAGYSDDQIAERFGELHQQRREQRRELVRQRAEAMAGALDAGGRRGDWVAVHAQHVAATKQYEEFIEYAMQEFEMGYDEAVDAWYSPEAE